MMGFTIWEATVNGCELAVAAYLNYHVVLFNHLADGTLWYW